MIRSVRECNLSDPAAFRQEVIGSYAPLVIRGLVKDWPSVAAGAASAAHFRDYARRFDTGGAAEVFVGQPEIGGRFFYKPELKSFNFERRQASFAEVLNSLVALQTASRPPAIYAGAVGTDRCLPGFSQDNPLPLIEGLDATPRIWIGNRSRISIHFDISDNIACVVTGKRRFTLFPPDQLANLYVGPLDHTMAGQPTSMVDLTAPDFDAYPRFRYALAAAQTAELSPGDAIYIPAMWWHQVEALCPFNVLVNYWWNDSPDAPQRFDAMVHAILGISHLPPERREAWREMFEHFVFRRDGDPAAHLAPEHRGVLGTPTVRLRAYIKQYLARGLSRP